MQHFWLEISTKYIVVAFLVCSAVIHENISILFTLNEDYLTDLTATIKVPKREIWLIAELNNSE